MYDLYCCEEQAAEGDDFDAAPVVLVTDPDDESDWLVVEPAGGGGSSEDGGSDGNPAEGVDYPDESPDEGSDLSSDDERALRPFGGIGGCESEEYDTVAYEEQEENLRWAPRR